MRRLKDGEKRMMKKTEPRLQGLHVITRADPVRGRSHVDAAKAAIEGGARILQLRDKEATTRELLETAREIRRLTKQAGALFIVNDRLEAALAAGADGVHLGPEDLPVETARRLAGEGFIIGASAGSVEEAKAAEQAGADYLGVGPIFAAPSKPDAGPPLGAGVIRRIKAAVNLPLIAIGGISIDNAGEVMKAGADGIAVISAVSGAEDMTEAVRDLVRLVES
jgi:thiamine-phosphate pyrophosphorylase